MSKNKAKMDPNKKAVLIYSGELALFAVVFLVLGILFLCRVIAVSDWKRYVIAIAPLPGVVWAYATFIWTLVSPKKRAKTSLLDKVLVLPSATFGAVLAVYMLAKGIMEASEDVIAPCVGGLFLYFSVIYLVECIYHYKHPIPGLLEDEKQGEEPSQEAPAEENKENE